MHKPEVLIQIFNRLFHQRERTVLVSGDNEPFYQPAKHQEDYHRILFAHGFFASALHEIAHWCIAGEKRRLLEDYGYWYRPEGRSASEQAEFAKVEAKPQALEWIFHQSANHTFTISLDNPSKDLEDYTPFKKAVLTEIGEFRLKGLPERAKMFQQALAAHYQQPQDFTQYRFCLSQLA